MGPPPGGPTRRQPSPRGWIWLVAVGAVLLALLVRTHSVSSEDVIIFCVIVPSIILHEISHGMVALAFGDDTAKRAGRLTLNPLRHIDIVGTIIVPIITILAGIGYFGWAKPVPVNVNRLRSPRNQTVLVSLAGPLTNITISAAFGVLFRFTYGSGWAGPLLLARILVAAGVLNLWIAMFNLIPIPPLDGSAAIERLMPAAWWPQYLRVRSMGFVVILVALALLSYAHSYPVQAVFDHVDRWWVELFG